MSEIKDEKPKPCPFCGGDNIQYVVRDVCDKMRYECQDCESHSGYGGYCDEEELDIWNTRPTEDALRARITELEESLHGADRQKAELEGIINSLNNAFAELPDFLSENCLTVTDLTPELLEEYLSLLSEKPEREVVK